MGALTMEIEKINKTIIDNQKQVEKLTKKLEREKEEKKTQKEYEKDLKIALENDLYDSIDRVFERVLNENGTNETTLELALLEYYKADVRTSCIDEFGANEIEKRYLDKIYDKTLKRVYNKWKNHVQYYQIQETIKQQKQEEQDAKFENGVKIFFNILKWICIIIFAPIVLLFIFISMCAKGK